ncbi:MULTISPECIES: cytochrome P450 [Nocardia]|uniref:cytochrome P450 n=1 Tax=Nocardia TaxID=1817 RepID=UPI0024556994|nr:MULTISPECIES: cytochrome P450 [Nocardia]
MPTTPSRTSESGSGNRPPGPRGSLGPTLRFQYAPLQFLARMLDEHGDIFTVDLLGMPTIVLNHPRFVDHVLKRHHHNYERNGPAVEMARKMFGNGVGTAARPEWLWQRRLLQPAFHRRRITEFTEIMASSIATTLHRWDRAMTSGATIDVGSEMTDLTLRIVLRTLFDLHPADAKLRIFSDSFTVATQELASFMRFPLLPMSVPTPGHYRFRQALNVLDSATYEMICLQRSNQGSHRSLLSRIMEARDTETGERMNVRQIRDEVLTMLFAGHETSANTLTWVWHLLGCHPEVEERLRAEIDTVVGDRQPLMADLPRLTYTRQVIQETLRLYSPAWQNYRQAVDDDIIGGYRIPAGTTVFWSYYFVHRHQSYWPNPDQFDPDRFSAADGARVETPGYYPFGAGPRLCIGNNFAMAELQLTIAMTLQRYRLIPTSNRPIDPVALITLHPRRPMTVTLEPYRP